VDKLAYQKSNRENMQNLKLFSVTIQGLPTEIIFSDFCRNATSIDKTEKELNGNMDVSKTGY